MSVTFCGRYIAELSYRVPEVRHRPVDAIEQRSLGTIHRSQSAQWGVELYVVNELPLMNLFIYFLHRCTLLAGMEFVPLMNCL